MGGGGCIEKSGEKKIIKEKKKNVSKNFCEKL